MVSIWSFGWTEGKGKPMSEPARQNFGVLKEENRSLAVVGLNRLLY